jgi:ketosteroid isomerase-like protein
MMTLSAVSAPAEQNDAAMKATLENRYQDWLSAANRKNASAMTALYDEAAVLMPKSEEPVIGKTAIAE